MTKATRLDHIIGGFLGQLLSLSFFGWSLYEWYRDHNLWILALIAAASMLRVDKSRRRVLGDEQWRHKRQSMTVSKEPTATQSAPFVDRVLARLGHPLFLFAAVVGGGLVLWHYVTTPAPSGNELRTALGAVVLVPMVFLCDWYRRRFFARNRAAGEPLLTRRDGRQMTLAEYVAERRVTCLVPALNAPPSVGEAIGSLPQNLRALVGADETDQGKAKRVLLLLDQ